MDLVKFKVLKEYKYNYVAHRTGHRKASRVTV